MIPVLKIVNTSVSTDANIEVYRLHSNTSRCSDVAITAKTELFGGFMEFEMLLNYEANFYPVLGSGCTVSLGDTYLYRGYFADVPTTTGAEPSLKYRVVSVFELLKQYKITVSFNNTNIFDILNSLKDSIDARFIDMDVLLIAADSQYLKNILIDSLEFKNTSIFKILETINNFIPEYRIYFLDTNLVIKNISNSEYSLFENYDFNGITENRSTDKILNNFKGYRKNTSDGQTYYVGAAKDGDSVVLYGEKIKELSFSENTSTNDIMKILQAQLSKNRLPSIEIDIKNYHSKKNIVLEMEKYTIKGRIRDNFIIIDTMEDFTNWDTINLSNTKHEVSADCVFGLNSLRFNLFSGSTGELATYTLENPLFNVLNFDFWFKLEGGASFNLILQDSVGNELIEKITISGRWFNLRKKINFKTQDYILKADNNRLLKNSENKFIEVTTGDVLRGLSFIKIEFTSDVGSVYIDRLAATTNQSKVYEQNLLERIDTVVNGTILSDLKFGTQLSNVKTELLEKIYKGDKAFEAQKIS